MSNANSNHPVEPRCPIDPMEIVTGKFTPKEILYQHDHFVIAVGLWEGDLGVACRWHLPDGSEIGYPNGYGRPQWFLLPLSVGDVVHQGHALNPEQIALIFRGPKA